MASVEHLLNRMRHEVSPGQEHLGEADLNRLIRLTRQLLAQKADNGEELRRYLAIPRANHRRTSRVGASGGA